MLHWQELSDGHVAIRAEKCRKLLQDIAESMLPNLQQASAILEASPIWSCSLTRGSIWGEGRLQQWLIITQPPAFSQPDDNLLEGRLRCVYPPPGDVILLFCCSQGQDDERDSLVELLQSQIIMMHSEWQNAHPQRDAGKDTTCATQNGRIEALRLCLSLVG